MTRKRICIISFSNICQDGRALRQIEYLLPHYDLTVIGYGKAPSDNITWYSVPTSTRFSRAVTTLLLLLARMLPFLYEVWYRQKPTYRYALEFARQSGADAFYANEWGTLPIAIEVAKATNAKVVYDAYEYSPLVQENRWWWMLLMAPVVRRILRRYGPQADATITVCTPIAERYKKEFGFDPIIVCNAPRYEAVPARTDNKKADQPRTIRLIHHGAALDDRRLEWMIEALAQMDTRFTLDFMLVGSPKYIKYLDTLGQKLAPGRVTFRDPVAPNQIVQTIAEYDIGFCLIAPSNYNYYMALPNKFFDCIVAGLAVCIGPSPAMMELVQKYGFGCISPSFKPKDVAETLNKLTPDELANMQQAARHAATIYNADKEMAKVIEVYDHLLGKGQNPVTSAMKK